MQLKFWWLIPFLGLISWSALFAAIAYKNYETTIMNSVFKPRNDMVKVALGLSFLTVLNNLLWLSIGKGTVVNVFQQALMLVFQMTVFQYAMKIFDPIQRIMPKEFIKRVCNLAKLILGVLALVLAVLIRINDVYDVDTMGTETDYVALYFLLMDFLFCIFAWYFTWVFFNIYISIRRGINYNSADAKESEVFNLRKRWLIDSIDLKALSIKSDPHCLSVLKLQKIMIERFMFYMILVLCMNVYKLSWGSSQYECSARVSCTPSISERNFQRAVNSLSYWMPDVIFMTVWLVLLVKPIACVALPEEYTTNNSIDDVKTGRPEHSDSGREFSKSRDGTDELSFDTDGSGIKLSLISDAVGGLTERSLSKDGFLNNTPRSDSRVDEVREIAISCEEMILFHRETGIPVTTMFAGRDTFAVLSMCSHDSSGMTRKISSVDNSANLNNSNMDRVAWTEVGRSDCRLNKANPFFHSVFVVPNSPLSGVVYRIDLYNVEEDSDSAFHPDNAVLREHELIATVLLTEEELHGLTDSVAREKPLREGGLLLMEYQSKSVRKDIIMAKISSKFSELYIGTGGKMLVSARKVRPFSQKFGVLQSVNGLEQKGSEDDNTFKMDAIIRSFIATTTGNTEKRFDVILREELVETPFSFNIPAAYLRSLIPERVMELEIVLERLGLHDVMMDTEPSAAVDSLQWSTEFVKSISANIETMRAAVHAYENTVDKFKKSSDKKNKGLEFVPVNLHVHIFEMSSQHCMRDLDRKDSDCYIDDQDKQFVCDFITVGAFAAHSKKFKQGGLWHLMKQFEYRLMQISPETSLSEIADEGDFLLPNQMWSIKVLQHLPLDPLLLHLAFKARERFDICVSQCLSSVAAGFLARVKLMTPAILERAVTIGMLFQFESLLSTQGHELGMLSDFFCAIKFLDYVQVRVYEMPDTDRGNKQTAVRIYREHELYIIDLGFVPALFQDLPTMIKQGCGVAVVPVMFTVGINELQTYAETMAGKKVFHLQDLINMESLSRIEAYCGLVQQYDNGDLDDEKAALSGKDRDNDSERTAPRSRTKKCNSLNKSEQNFVEDITKPVSEGSTLWLQSRASCHMQFEALRERLDSVSISKDFDLSSVTWGEVERAVSGFSLWNGAKKNAHEKDASSKLVQKENSLLSVRSDIESVHIEDDGE
jgi:uncharacterized protein (UPF0212 family)